MWKQLFSSVVPPSKKADPTLNHHRKTSESSAKEDGRPYPRGLKEVIEHLEKKRQVAEAEGERSTKKVPSYVVEALGPGWKFRGGLGSGAYAKVFEASWVGEDTKKTPTNFLNVKDPFSLRKNISGSSLSSLTSEPVACAIKVMRDVDMESWEISRRFVRELLILRRLRAVDGVVSLYGCTTPKASSSRHKRDLYLFFEACLTDFRQLTKMDVFLTLPDARRLLRELLTAVAFMHASDIIHRDIKPANLLLHADGTLKVCDFGLARVVPPAPRLPEDDEGDGFDSRAPSLVESEKSDDCAKKTSFGGLEAELSSCRSPRMMSPDLDEVDQGGDVDAPEEDDDPLHNELKGDDDIFRTDDERRRRDNAITPPVAPGVTDDLFRGTQIPRPPPVRQLSDAKAPKVAPDVTSPRRSDSGLPIDATAQEKTTGRPSSAKKRVAFAVGDGEDDIDYASDSSSAKQNNGLVEKAAGPHLTNGATTQTTQAKKTNNAPTNNKKDKKNKKKPNLVDELPRAELRRMYTEHVVTRWYRAPELVLLQPYNGAVDVWAAACVFAECFLGTCVEVCPDRRDRRPLFPGRSCYPLSPMGTSRDGWHQKNDQLQAIFNVRGTPRLEEIDSLDNDYRGMKNYLRRLPKVDKVPLQKIFPAADPKAIHLLEHMLAFAPEKRVSVSEALAHEYFTTPCSATRNAAKQQKRQASKFTSSASSSSMSSDGDAKCEAPFAMRASSSTEDLATPATSIAPRQPDARDAGFGDWSPASSRGGLPSRPSRTALGPAMSQLEDDEAWERVAQHEADADMSRVLWKLVDCFPSELSTRGGLVGDERHDERDENQVGPHSFAGGEINNGSSSRAGHPMNETVTDPAGMRKQNPPAASSKNFLKRRPFKLPAHWSAFLTDPRGKRGPSSQQQQFQSQQHPRAPAKE